MAVKLIKVLVRRGNEKNVSKFFSNEANEATEET